MIISGIFTILMPAGASLHWVVLLILRAIVGLAHGVIWPSMTVIMAHWAPPNERGKLIGFMNAGLFERTADDLTRVDLGRFCAIKSEMS